MATLHRFVASLALLSALPLSAHAADTPSNAGRNPAAAQALFEEAQQLVAAADYEQACPKFKASYALDAAGGTLLNLADCLEKQGRTASAWSTFKEALVQARRDGRKEREEYAQRHIRALEPKLAYLTVQVPAASNVAGLAIEVDGTELGSAAWGAALPVDPGAHVLHAEAPGFEAFEQSITLDTAPGTRQTLLLPPLRATEASSPPAAPEQDPMRDATQPGNPARTWAWITGGVGVAAVGVGSYFGLRAFSLWDEREAGCVDGCTSDAKAAGDDADTAATIATVSMSAGVALLATATVLFLYSGDEPEAEMAASTRFSVTPTDRGATLSWGGQF